MSHSAQGRSASTRKADLSTGRVRYWSVRILGLSLVLALAACGNSEEPSALMNFINSMKKNYQQNTLPGASLVKKKCASCHYIDKNMRKIGPSLLGIIGRVPTSQGIPFARWNVQTLDLWLKDPAAVKPGTTMVFPGIKSAQQRQDIIAYLKQL